MPNTLEGTKKKMPYPQTDHLSCRREEKGGDPPFSMPSKKGSGFSTAVGTCFSDICDVSKKRKKRDVVSRRAGKKKEKRSVLSRPRSAKVCLDLHVEHEA